MAFGLVPSFGSAYGSDNLWVYHFCAYLILSVCLCLIWFIMFAGYMELEPNEARAMVFFGKYKGTFKETGFFWVNPFLNKKKLSLRARNLDVEPIR